MERSLLSWIRAMAAMILEVLRKEGLSEKEFAMAMARNIQKAGEAKNIKVILTRTDDKGYDP